nr:glycoside hydrolase family 3 C-terminal domain-containing protein [Agrilactobacillus composti]
MVLLKNDEAVLPLTPKDKLLIVGDLAQKPRYQGGGSSHVSEYQMATPVMAARRPMPILNFNRAMPWLKLSRMMA